MYFYFGKQPVEVAAICNQAQQLASMDSKSQAEPRMNVLEFLAQESAAFGLFGR